MMHTRIFTVVALGMALSQLACGAPEDEDDPIVEPEPKPDPDPEPDPEPEPEPEPEPQPEPQPYGAECTYSTQCDGGLCLDGLCSRYCEVDDLHSCQQVDAFCVPLVSGEHGCYGFVDTGHDADGAILSIGDQKAAHLGTLGDADLFRLDYWRDGTFEVVAQGDAVDLQIEFYNSIAEPVGVFTGDGRGQPADALVTIYAPSYDWLVVRNVGTTTGPYTVALRDY